MPKLAPGKERNIHMKKSIILLGLIFALLCGCSQQSAGTSSGRISVENGAFTCTPEDIVNEINNMVESDTDGILLGLGEYPGSGESMYPDDLGRLQLTMEANEAGNLTSVRLYWDSSTNNENVITSAGAYCSILFDLLSHDNSEAIYSSISEIISEGSGTVDFENNGVLVSFLSGRGLNYLDIDAQE